MNCIETSQLTHHYSANETAVDNVALLVPNGSIYGFLGPNGAGKTTTLRLILGLIKKQSGTISIFGKSFGENRLDILRNIGSLIESPSLYGHLTAYENLLILQKIYQCPVERIKEVLALVGLSNTGKKRAGKFSLGMKQRLSIAMALLNTPKLLVLDEPTNGLDPQGILEMRELLKQLNREKGITIIISSHLLAEIEKIATHVGIINHGKLIFQGTMSDLNNKQIESSSIIIDTNDNARAMDVISRFTSTAKLQNNKIVLPLIERNIVAEMNKALIQQQLDVYELSIVKNDLESIFFNLVNN
jgi:ABC-type multidrug transport system ATPase subunit